MQLNYFRGFTDSEPKDITLEEVVRLMTDDASVRDLTDKYRYYLSAGDESNARRYKSLLPCFAVAVRFRGGKHKKHIVDFTDLSIVDLDHIVLTDMMRVLSLIREDPHTLLCYTTVSGEGVRVIFRYKRNDNGNSLPDEKSSSSFSFYKRAFEQGNAYYRQLTGCDYDEKCKNATRLSCLSHDPAVYYNPEAEPFIIEMSRKPVGRPRKGVSPEKVEEHVCAELQRRGVEYIAGNHNNYIAQACYLMNRYGVSEEACTDWALARFADYYAEGNNVPGIVASCYQQTEEHATQRPPRETQERYASVREIQDYLTEKDIRIRHNTVSRKWEILITQNENDNENENENSHPDGRSSSKKSSSSFSSSLKKHPAYTDLTDRHVNSLYRAFSLDTNRRLRISDLYIIIESDFYPTYHPFREYLENLPQWDGYDYIEALASRVHVVGCSQEMHNRYFKKWFVAMVATWIVDDVTNHEILTNIGPQGIYKSTFMRQLLPPALRDYFSARNFAHRMSKDDRLELTEMGLIALEELDHMKDYELNQLKAITTDPTVNERAAYAHYRERRAHIASFCGTGNNPRFLTDLTGNRRWLPFMVDSIDSPYEHPFPYEGLYAQAYALWRSHFPYWLDEAENLELEQHNRHFEEPNIEEELILTYLRPPYSDEVGEFVTATRIIELIGSYIKTQLSPRHITMIMKRLGFEQRRTSKARGWNVVILTGDDIKNNQRQDAHQSHPE